MSLVDCLEMEFIQMKKCESCREQDARYVVTLTNMRSEVLDDVKLCLECLANNILDVLSPGDPPEPETEILD